MGKAETLSEAEISLALAVPAARLHDFARPELQSYLSRAKQRELVAWLRFSFYGDLASKVAACMTMPDYEQRVRALVLSNPHRETPAKKDPARQSPVNWARRFSERKDSAAMAQLVAQLKAAACQGDVKAMEVLAYAWQYGFVDGKAGVEQALRWYLAAAAQGDGAAMGQIGDMLLERGDVTQAGDWYEKGADCGDDYCQKKVVAQEDARI